MRKLICQLALFVAGGVVSAHVAPAAAAPQKKDDKKEAKKDEKKDENPGEPGGIEVYQGKDGWRFRVTNSEGKSIAIGMQGYAKKEDCLAAVELLKTTMAKGKVAEVTKD